MKSHIKDGKLNYEISSNFLKLVIYQKKKISKLESANLKLVFNEKDEHHMQSLVCMELFIMKMGECTLYTEHFEILYIAKAIGKGLINW